MDPEENKYKAKRKYRDARIAQRYDRTRFTGILGRIKLRRDRSLVLRALREVGPVGLLLDLPSGTGRFTPVLEKGAQQVVSGDVSFEMMEVAARRFPSPKVSYVQCSVERLSFQDDCFDLTFTARFLLHLPGALRQAAFRELARVSRRWVLFDCLMEGGPKGWLRKLLSRAKRGGKSKKRMEKGDLKRALDLAGLRIRHIYHPSRLFSEKWIVLCEREGRLA